MKPDWQRKKLGSDAVSVAPASPMRSWEWPFRVVLSWGQKTKPFSCPASTSYWVDIALLRRHSSGKVTF